jgi:hypothetical protein
MLIYVIQVEMLKFWEKKKKKKNSFPMNSFVNGIFNIFTGESSKLVNYSTEMC